MGSTRGGLSVGAYTRLYQALVRIQLLALEAVLSAALVSASIVSATAAREVTGPASRSSGSDERAVSGATSLGLAGKIRSFCSTVGSNQPKGLTAGAVLVSVRDARSGEQETLLISAGAASIWSFG